MTFLTPEASKAVQDYLNYRNRTVKTDHKKRADQLEKQRAGNPDGYLFIGRQIPNEYLTTGNEELRKLKENSMIGIYHQISEDAQKNTEKGIWDIVRSHNLRKWFNSRLMNAGAEVMKVDFMMGHQIEGSKAHYYVADPTELKEEYKKYIPYLTIQKEADISESVDYQRIKEENDILRAETARHVVERSELQELRREVQQQKMIDDHELNQLVEHLVEQRIGNYMKEVDHIFKDVLKLDLNKPLSPEEKKNIPEW